MCYQERIRYIHIQENISVYIYAFSVPNNCTYKTFATPKETPKETSKETPNNFFFIPFYAILKPLSSINYAEISIH